MTPAIPHLSSAIQNPWLLIWAVGEPQLQAYQLPSFFKRTGAFWLQAPSACLFSGSCVSAIGRKVWWSRDRNRIYTHCIKQYSSFYPACMLSWVTVALFFPLASFPVFKIHSANHNIHLFCFSEIWCSVTCGRLSAVYLNQFLTLQLAMRIEYKYTNIPIISVGVPVSALRNVL